MKKILLILLWAWFLTSCSPQIYTPPEVQPASTARGPDVVQKPNWVVTKPIKAGYYIGLGSAKTGQEDYHRIAKDKALEDIATEISVTVDASSFLYQAEFGRQFSEKYEGYIKTSSLEELSEFELLNDWSDGTEYWVAYGLSKSRHRELKEQQLAAALAIATGHLNNAISDEGQGKFLAAIHNYLKTVDALKNHLHEPLKAEINANSQLIIPYCTNAIRGILNDLKVKEDQIEFNPVDRIPAAVTLSCRGLVAKGFSLIANESKLTTNKNGQVFIKMDAVADRSILSLAVSKGSLRSFGKDNVVLQGLIDSFNVPKFNLPVSIMALTIHVEGQELNLDAGKFRPLIKPALVNFLSTYGFVFSETPENAAFKLSYKVTTRKGQETNGLYVCWADVEINFYNASNELIYSDQLLGVKGIHASYQAAGTKAIENVAPLLKEKIVQPFIKNVF